LVVVGFYRYVRNPMYLGFAVGWIGLWVVFGHANPRVITAVAAVALGVHLFVVFYEEPTLRKKFGARIRSVFSERAPLVAATAALERYFSRWDDVPYPRVARDILSLLFQRDISSGVKIQKNPSALRHHVRVSRGRPFETARACVLFEAQTGAIRVGSGAADVRQA
jgi:hypothetical protein